MIKNKSFTLIELLVVIVIIGILAGVIMISTSSSIDKANIAKSKVFEESIENNLAADMVSRWKMDEGTGTVVADVWGNSSGALVNGPAWESGNRCVSGNCLSFDGSNDYIDCGSMNSYFTNSITVSVWIKNKNSGHEKIVIGDGWYNQSTGRSWWILKDNDNKLKFGIEIDNHEARYDSVIDTTGSVWYHVVGVYNGATIKIYVNGEKGVDYTETSVLATNSNVRIGSGYYNGYEYMYSFYGLIDDVKLFNEALSSSEIKQNYIAGLNSMLSNGSISKQEYNERINTLAYEQE